MSLSRRLAHRSMRSVSKRAENSFMFQIRIMQAGYDMDDPESKTAFIMKSQRSCLGLPRSLSGQTIRRQCPERYSIPYDDLRKLVNSMAMKGGIVKPQTSLKWNQ